MNASDYLEIAIAVVRVFYKVYEKAH